MPKTAGTKAAVVFERQIETRVQEHLRASAVRPQQAAAFDEQPFQFPGL